MLLQQIKTLLDQQGYELTHFEKLIEVPVDLINVVLEEDEKQRPQYLTISLYPSMADLEESIFVQFYFQFPFEVKPENLSLATREIGNVNRLLALGHFNLSKDERVIYFKYVLAFPKDVEMKPGFLNDIMDMCLFPLEKFSNQFEAIATSIGS